MRQCLEVNRLDRPFHRHFPGIGRFDKRKILFNYSTNDTISCGLKTLITSGIKMVSSFFALAVE